MDSLPNLTMRARGCRSVLSAMALCLLVMTVVAAHQTNSSATLESIGPVIIVSGDQGYHSLTLANWKDGMTIDVRKARWATFGWGRALLDETIKDTAINPYPLQFGADWVGPFPTRLDLYNYGNCTPAQRNGLRVIGGTVEGTQPSYTTWKQSKASDSTAITFNVLNCTVDGMRIHNVHDGFRPLEGNGFTIRNCWVSDVRDDVLENDGFAGGVIEDCLLENSYCLYSARNTFGGAGVRTCPIDPKTGKQAGKGGAQAEAHGGGAAARVRFERCLISLGNLPGTNSKEIERGPGWGTFWKQSDNRNPQVEIIGNVFFIPKPVPGCAPHRYDVTPQGCGKSEGNIVIWMGDGRYPFKPRGFTVLSGEEGLRYWERARREWIARHPDVGRVQGDPGYDAVHHGQADFAPANAVKMAVEYRADNKRRTALDDKN